MYQEFFGVWGELEVLLAIDPLDMVPDVLLSLFGVQLAELDISSIVPVSPPFRKRDADACLLQGLDNRGLLFVVRNPVVNQPSNFYIFKKNKIQIAILFNLILEKRQGE